MTSSKLWLSAVLAGTVISHAAPAPMEPASRTLFVFVHGINPKCSGAIDNATDSDKSRSLACEAGPLPFEEEEPLLGPFCVDRSQLLGRGSHVWVKGLDNHRSADALFCVLHRDLFDAQYSLRSFTDPGDSPLSLAYELGDRDWTSPQNPALRSHAMEAMRRYAEDRRDRADVKRDQGSSLSEFEKKLQSFYPEGPITDLRQIFSVFADSMPSRMVVFAHSMGGLTTREYMMSNFYADDMDKVVTFDSPHLGSWVAKYNQAGIRTGWNVPTLLSATKLLYGLSMFSSVDPVSDNIATMLTISGSAGLTAGLFQTYGGAIGNKFKGDEEGGAYLVPGSTDLNQLNAKTSMKCENSGCVPPKFVLYSTDGSLAPDDPSKLLTGSPLRMILPTEIADMTAAAMLAASRPWPAGTSASEILYRSLIASMFAEGGWNYSQHGSLPVANHSGNANGIPFLDRADLPTVRHEPLVFDEQIASAAVGMLAAHTVDVGAILVAFELALPAINTTAVLLGSPPLGQITKFGLGLGVGIKLGLSATAQFGLYAKSHAASHNLAVVQSAAERASTSYTDALGKTIELSPRWIENDLYEKPFVQVVWDGPTKATPDVRALRMNSGEILTPSMQVASSSLTPIEYSHPGWEERFAIREESQEPVGNSGTTVRKVKRWSLPFELLTTDDLRHMELQVDDLRPDLLEQLSVTIDWGKIRLVWDREKGADGGDPGTYRLSRFSPGKLEETQAGLPNPVDAYGRWNIDFGAFEEGSILRDGQNLVAISLVNHAGKRSIQRQFITRQATPPLVDMKFPQPWETVSIADGNLRARVTLLHYPGLTIDPSRSGWILERGNVLQRDHAEGTLTRFPNASDDASEVELDQPLGLEDDGEWTVMFRTVATTEEGETSVSESRIPFLLDRVAPKLELTGPTQAIRPGKDQEFLLEWMDREPSNHSVLELVRPRIRDEKGNVVVEMAPIPFVAGRQMVLRWNGKIGDQDAPDGVYSLDIDARDDALPDISTRSAVLDLRGGLASDLDAWSGTWDPDRDAAWRSLRSRNDLNWSTASTSFRIDATPPVAEFEALPSKPLARDERLRIRFRIRDPEAASSSETIRFHLDFTPVAGTVQTVHTLDATYDDIARELQDAVVRTEGETESGGEFLLPDGIWKVSGTATDGAGNQTRWPDLGTISIDRTAPTIASLRSTSVVIPQGLTATGEAILDAHGASTVEATWVAPDGTRISQSTSSSNGLWTTPYPEGMGASPGIWRLELSVQDEAGNRTYADTRVWVGLLPPKLTLAGTKGDETPTVTGTIVLQGLAMDPIVDDHEFASYALQWRWLGETEWRTEGMRVPAGRSFAEAPWKSRREQSYQGGLGFWDPPTGSGAIELRVLVDDGSGEVSGREAIREVYRAADEPLDFSVTSHIEDRLATGVTTRVGMEIRSGAPATSTYRAQAILTDARGELLLAKDLVDLRSSRFEGKPSADAPGAFQLWHDDVWHLRANRVCRKFDVRILVSQTETVTMKCPQDWTCDQHEIEAMAMPAAMGGTTYRRIVELSIPASASGELGFDLESQARMDFGGDQNTLGCTALSNTCGSIGTATELQAQLPGPRPGELVTGQTNLPWCEALGSIVLEPGLSSWSDDWNGLRPDGTVPAAGSATLEVVAWNPNTGRAVTASASATLLVGEGKIHAWADEAVSIATDAPSVQKKAGLGFTLEGRGAKLELEVLSGETLVRTLQGSGEWYEGRSASIPYSTSWDGTDATGSLVPAGDYVFRVREVEGSLLAEAKVSVTGSSWKEDPSLNLTLPESRWDEEAQAWRLEPMPELLVSTKASAALVQGGEFTYAADWSGKQLITTFPAARFSLMVHRHRETVKFGILFRMVLTQKVYGDDWACDGDRDGAHELNEQFSGVHVIELHPGETGRIDVQAAVRASGGGYKYRFEGGPHTVEYRVVPLSQVERLNANSASAWEQSGQVQLTAGSFVINDLQVTPTFGQFGTRPPVGPYDWNIPTAPDACETEVLDPFEDLDGKGVQVSAKSCGKTSPQDAEAFNPHRNLIQFRALPWIDETRTRDTIIVIPAPYDSVTRRSTGRDTHVTKQITYQVIEYAHGNATSECTGKAGRNEFGFHFELRVPEEYWNPPTGMENLANRFLRFDSWNKFLFGSNGYLAHDDFDNDGVGPADDDDPGEREGSLAAFETKRFHWRPRLTDILPRDVCSADAEGWTHCLRDGQKWTTEHGSRFADRILTRPNEDPLYFSEGDHGRNDETLTAWFENTPSQGDALWRATITQGKRSIELTSKNLKKENAVTFPVERGQGSGTIYNDFVLWYTDPVDIAVTPEGSLRDFQKDHWLTPMAWPLDSASFLREQTRIESECAALFTGLCRVHAAASGVRFGISDGLASLNPIYGSLAQQRFFEALGQGLHPDPAMLAGGIPKGTGTILHTGNLDPDGTGILRYSDATHFGSTLEGISLIDPIVVPRVVSWNGGALETRLETSPIRRALFWSQPPTANSWTLADDPRLSGAERLQTPRSWDPGSSTSRWDLLDLYLAGTGVSTPPSDAPALALFQDINGWKPNPALWNLELLDPLVEFRDGGSAADAFTIAAQRDATGADGLTASRRPAAWGLPEWFPVHGAIPAGETYQLGWIDRDGIWHPSGSPKRSNCPAHIGTEPGCLLGYVDASRLPATASVGILAGEGKERRFQSKSVIQGVLLDPMQSTEIRSLFGEVAIAFPPEALAGKSKAERSILVRALDPARSGIRTPKALAVAGPIVEVLPSQTFPSDPAKQPQVKVRLSRDDLANLADASGLGIFKIDPETGTVVPLAERSTTFVCEYNPCTAANAQSVEFTGLTASFSRFAILPLGTLDSRLWSFDISPRNGSSPRRAIHLGGIESSALRWQIDDDAQLEEDRDSTPPGYLETRVGADGDLEMDIPEGVHWIFATPREGGVAKSVRVERVAPRFEAQVVDLSPLVVGTVNGGAHRLATTNRNGIWTVILQDDEGALGFHEGILKFPETTLEFPSDILGHRWCGSVASRISFRSAEGEWIEQSGPLLIGDASLPEAHLTGSVVTTSEGPMLIAEATGHDAEGPVRGLVVSIQTEDGHALQEIRSAEDRLAVRFAIPVGADPIPRLRVVATAFDQGENHASVEAAFETPSMRPSKILWTEAESLARPTASTPVCVLESRRAIRTDSVQTLDWTLPQVAGEYVLAGRWRSSEPVVIQLELEGQKTTSWNLPAQPLWGDVIPMGVPLRIRGGEHLRLSLPTGMQWDGLALVEDASMLPGWHPPALSARQDAEVWVRDEGPHDANMVHPRLFVRNRGSSLLTGYHLRITVRPEFLRQPVVEMWWPTPLESNWEFEGNGLWSLNLDRTRIALQPEADDFQGIGAAFGLHDPQWSPWIREDDPAWWGGLSSDSMTRTDRIPVFDSAGTLISAWACAEESPWLSNDSPVATARRDLMAANPLLVDQSLSELTLVAQGDWNWQTAVVGLTPLDGKILEGILHFGDRSWPLTGWWQEIRIPNPSHQNLPVWLELPSGRRIQIQKWEE